MIEVPISGAFCLVCRQPATHPGPCTQLVVRGEDRDPTTCGGDVLQLFARVADPEDQR